MSAKVPVEINDDSDDEEDYGLCVDNKEEEADAKPAAIPDHQELLRIWKEKALLFLSAIPIVCIFLLL